MGVATVGEGLGVIGLRVPGVLAYRHLALRLVSTACKMATGASHEAGGAGGRREPSTEDGDLEPEVVSAFGEAFNNIAIHGYRDVPPGPVEIEVGWDDEKLVITFTDTGHPFDPSQVATPDLDVLHEHGMGLFIMRSCMDQVDYRPGPPNVLRLVKLLRHREARLPAPPEAESEPTVPPRTASVYDGGVSGPAPGVATDPLAAERGGAPASSRGSGAQRIRIVESSRQR